MRRAEPGPRYNIQEEDHNQPQISHTSFTSIASSKKEIAAWGLTLKEISLPITTSNDLDGQQRAFQVMKVQSGNLVGNSLFQKADILVEINRKEVYTSDALDAAIDALLYFQGIEVCVYREERLTVLKIASPNIEIEEK